MAKDTGTQRHGPYVVIEGFTIGTNFYAWFYWKLIQAWERRKTEKSIKSVPVENSDYFHAIASLVDVGHLQNSPKINEKIVRYICYKSPIEYIEIIMKS